MARKLQLREVDQTTREWIRNASDEIAARNGCRFDPALGQRVLDWWQQHLRLYEGAAWAGKPFVASDWQIDATMRMYGWVKYSERWSKLLGHEQWVRRFRFAVIFIPKKNKKSPTLAAHALYLLIGDGEKGQKVFLAARDGLQARDIAGKHAVEMLKQSPHLLEQCKLNQSRGVIQHLPTASVLQPIASADARSQESKEGINGCVLVDEVHVVDRKFMKRVSRAGISRMNPFQIEVSTAGNNPDGYGKERADYARKVINGEIEDPTLFAEIYEAPQDLSDAELDRDPVKWGKLANPAWGHTIDEEEYLADYQSSKQSISDLADFKMYRLNIWQQSSNPWLRNSAWNACAADYTLEDLAGARLFAGLDLSKTEDMTALVIAAPVGDRIYLWPFFWLPEETARRNNHLVKFLDWAHGGHLVLTPGEVVDYSFVERQIAEIHDKHGISKLLYDRTYAEELTQRLEDKHGIEREQFAQTIMTFAKPTAEFERMVISGKLAHPNHPILNWQAGHTHVRSDSNNNQRPMKPEKHDVRKIDGIVAAIMAVGGTLDDDGESVYENRGVLLL